MSLLLAALRRAADVRRQREEGARKTGQQATFQPTDERSIAATVGTAGHERHAPLSRARALAFSGVTHSNPRLVAHVLDSNTLYARERLRRAVLTIAALVATAIVLGAGGFVFHLHRDALLRARLDAARAPVAVATVAHVAAPSASGPDPETPRTPDGALARYQTLTAAGTAERADGQAAVIGVAQPQLDRERRAVRSEPVEAVTIARTGTHAKIVAALAAGYRAFHDGATAAALVHYRRALTLDEHNRDALLGLAAIAVRRGEHDEAAALYRGLLRENPRAPELHFALGTLYGGERRWRDALAAFREAHRYDRGSPDVLFNLAVSLDHLNEMAAAMRYYAAALRAVAERAGTFDLEAARARLRGLRQSRAGAG